MHAFARLLLLLSLAAVTGAGCFCGDYRDRLIDEAPRIEVSLKQLESGIRNMSGKEREKYLFDLEGYRISWKGKVISIDSPEGAGRYHIRVQDPGLPKSVIYLLADKSTAEKIGEDETISYEGLIETLEYDGDFAVTIQPVRIPENDKN